MFFDGKLTRLYIHFLVRVNPLSDIFSIHSWYLFSGHFNSGTRGTTFLPSFCHFAGQINYPFDFISWRNILDEFYDSGRPMDIIFRQAQSQSSSYMICIILCQTHFLQVPLACNIMLHTLTGLTVWCKLWCNHMLPTKFEAN